MSDECLCDVLRQPVLSVRDVRLIHVRFFEKKNTMFYKFIGKKPTSSTERQVIVWTIIIIALVLELAMIGLSFKASPDQAELALKVRHNGYILLGASIVLRSAVSPSPVRFAQCEGAKV